MNILFDLSSLLLTLSLRAEVFLLLENNAIFLTEYVYFSKFKYFCHFTFHMSIVASYGT